VSRSHNRKGISLRDAAMQVVRTLQEAGHEALFAGGCVRDMLRGEQPDDYDVATSARPEDVLRRFRRTTEVGAMFGVVLVRIGRHAIEVATFREDLDYADGRHPEGVRFTGAREDAARRDFTINGMFYDPIREEVVDYVGGQQDLETGVIRAIGDPARRFAEDHLRILRAVRFAARFDYAIDDATWQAMRAEALHLTRISSERICQELEKMLANRRRVRAFRDLHDCGAVPHLWTGADRLAPGADEIERILAALPTRAAFSTALAAILLPLGSLAADEACVALRCSNQTRDTVTWLIANLPALDDPSRLDDAGLKRRMAHPAFDALLDLHEAALCAKGRSTEPNECLRTRAAAIPRDAVAPPPLLTGYDLQALGIPAGPNYKRILDATYDAQLNGQITDHASAIEFARQRANDRGDTQ